MFFTTHTVSGLTHVFVVIGAFLGPERNPAQAVTLKQKADALVRFVRTGDDRACKDILTAINAKKARSEDSLRKQIEAQKGLEEGIARARANLAGAGRNAPLVRKHIDSSLRTLEICTRQVERYTKLVKGRVQEENTFVQVYHFVSDIRARLLPRPDARQATR